MGWDRSRRVLMFAIKLRQLLTGEDYVLLKTFGDSLRSARWFTNGVISADKPTASLIRETKNDEKILGLTKKITELLSGEVSRRYEDTTIFFTREEWEFVEEHKYLYEDVLMENTSLLKSIDDNRDTILHNTSLEKVSHLNTTAQDRNHVSEKILHLTKELLDLLTKEKYIVMWNHGNVASPGGSDHLSGLLTESSAPSLIHGEILALTNKITELLTGEASIRYEDITVHFSMDEWDYVEEHKDQYKDFMLKPEISQSYDKPSSLDSSKEKPLEFHKQGKDSSENFCVLTGSPPHHVAKSTKCFQKHSYIGKHKERYEEQTPVPCSKCGKELRRTYGGQSDTNTDSIGSKEICMKCLLDQRGVVRKKRPFPCTLCSCSFSKRENLEIHLRVVHTMTKNFPCPECDKVFPCKSSHETHMRVHTGEKPHQCSECGKCFSNPGNLQAHYRVHTGERPFPCTECNKTFRYKSHLVAHQRFHTGQTLLCPECGKSFVYQSHLEKHLRIHTGEKPFECPECGKGFKRRFQLREHVMTHTGETFNCEECNKSYRFVYNLLRHQKSHAGRKPFYCPECGKGFLHSASLTEHKMTHTGEKPYSCPECGKPFISSKYLLRHQKTHFKNKSRKPK